MKLHLTHLSLALTAIAFAGCGEEDSKSGGHDHENLAEAWTEGYAENEEAKADGRGCSGVLTPDTGGFDGRITLTFDDGPSSKTTRQVMEVLRAHGAPATFFMLGKNAKANPDIVKEIIADEDFLVASHSWDHPKMSKLSGASVASQLDRTNEVLEGLGAPEIKFFRAPYGMLGCDVKAQVKERGMTSIGWNVDTADWAFTRGTASWSGVPSAYRDDMAGYTMLQVSKNNGGNVLFHDIHQNTADKLDGILTKMEALGMVFVPLDDASTFPLANGVTPPVKPFIGDACTGDTECDFTANGEKGFCHEGTFCAIRCAGSCPDKAGKASTFCIAEAVQGGICVSKAAEENNFCESVEGTVARDLERYVGDSGADARLAKVCSLSDTLVVDTPGVYSLRHSPNGVMPLGLRLETAQKVTVTINDANGCAPGVAVGFAQEGEELIWDDNENDECASVSMALEAGEYTIMIDTFPQAELRTALVEFE